MRIGEALRDVPLLENTDAAADVRDIHYDSRRVRPGDVFVAMRGGTNDGNGFVDAATQAGAGLIVTDTREVWERLHGRFPAVLVQDGRRALAGIAANLFDHPKQKLKVSAVTGTNGKTTTAFLLEQMLRSVGRKCVLIGTIETHIGDEVRASEHTTPEASDLLRLFADGVKAGATEVVMEMSSHALAQERVWGVPVDVAMFTNLTQDHLDFHGSMEAYFAAKARLFAGVGADAPKVAVINTDDPFANKLMGLNASSQLMTYGIDSGDFQARNLNLEGGRTTFLWNTPSGSVELQSSLTGRVNVYNLMAAACASLARGLSLEEIVESARHLDHVPGRFEVVNGSYGAGFTVVVDYAHTDDALRNLIKLARDLVKPAGGRVITLFGCGGDRDKTKRPKMGRAAGEGSDVVVLTSDNPRSEPPATILREALAGLNGTSARVIVEEDRAAAITLAIGEARAGDIVLLAGKGHEKGQIVGDRTLPFDDVDVASTVLQALR